MPPATQVQAWVAVLESAAPCTAGAVPETRPDPFTTMAAADESAVGVSVIELTASATEAV